MSKLKDYMMRQDYVSNLRYKGIFTDKEGIMWEMHILHQKSQLLNSNGIVEMVLGVSPAILRRESERMGGLVGTTVTINLLSLSDGQYRYLYQLPEGAVKLCLWRDGTLYYIGTLDPEGYEEDYSKLNKYFVELRFSDFGSGQRLGHLYKGIKSLEQWIRLFVKDIISHSEYGLGLISLPLPSEDRLVEDKCSVLMTAEYPKVDRSDDDYIPHFPGNRPEQFLEFAAVSSQVFYEDEDKSMTIYDALDGLLRSFALRLEQRGGHFVLYDVDYLLSLDDQDLTPRSDDALFVADEGYNSLAIEPASKPELARKSYIIPKPRAIYQHRHPRIDRPNVYAYSAILEPMQGGISDMFVVETTAETLGNSERFLALVWQPILYKWAYREFRRDNAFNHQHNVINHYLGGQRRFNDDGEEVQESVYVDYPGEAIEATYSLRYARKNLTEPHQVYPNPPFGLEKWLELPHLPYRNVFAPFAGTSRTPSICHIELDVPSAEGIFLGLEAQLYLSEMPSLYQELKDDFVARVSLFDNENRRMGGHPSIERKVYNDLDKLANVMVYASLTITQGNTTYALKYRREHYYESYGAIYINSWADVGRHRLYWERLKDGESIPFFFMPFGGGNFKTESWNKIEHELVDFGVYKTDKFDKFWAYEDLYKKGLHIPAPPISGTASLKIYPNLTFGGRFLHTWREPSFQELVEESIACTLLRYGDWTPSYVLLKDISLSIHSLKNDLGEGVEQSTASQEGNHKSKYYATLNYNAYEELKLEPIIAYDQLIASHSPNRLRSILGTEITGLYRIDWQSYHSEVKTNGNNPWVVHHYYKTAIKSSVQLLANNAFLHYGQRKHCIEGTFRCIRELKPIAFLGHRYLILEEEEDLRKATSELRLAEIRHDWYSPKLTEGRGNTTSYRLKHSGKIELFGENDI